MFISNTTNASLWLFPYLNTIEIYCSLIIFRLRGINKSETFRNVRRRSESGRTFHKRFNTKSRRTSTLAEVHTYPRAYPAVKRRQELLESAEVV